VAEGCKFTKRQRIHAALLCHSPALGEVAADFAEVLAVSTEVDAASFHMGALGRLTASLLSILSPLF
jgi:hypothetical protein